MVILQVSISMFLVILAGWLARRRGYLSGEATTALSRFVVDWSLPALFFVHLLRTVNAADLYARWYIPLLGAGIILVGEAVGAVLAPLFCPRGQRRTFVFLVAINNWIYLPLPIAAALYGAEGIQTVLLVNVGAVIVLWTLGVWTLRGGRPNGEALRNLLLNPGLLATVAGIGLALAAPGLGACLDADSVTASAGVLATKAVLQALELVGSVTVPFALVVTGAQLGGLELHTHRPGRALAGVLLARMLVAPATFVALMVAAMGLGAHFLPGPLHVCAMISAMPVAVSCGIYTERFGGDPVLAARAIFWTTLAGLATVPALSVLFLKCVG